MTDESTDRQRQRFDRVLGGWDGIPGVRVTKPATVMQTIPILNETTTAVVQTMRNEDGYTILLQVVDSTGHMRIVIPDKVAAAIYRQRERLADRSTPESRRRAKAKRDRERARAAKAARSAAWRARHPDGGPLARARRPAPRRKATAE